MSDLTHSEFPSTAVTLKDGHPITTSQAVAGVFRKTHKDVLRAIRNLDCSDDFTRRNFAPADYIDKNGDKQPMYEITRDGMVYLVMGFTGPLAARFKVAYIDAFNRLEIQAIEAAAVRPAEYQALRTQLLDANDRARGLEILLLRYQPRFRDLKRYVGLGLTDTECARLLQCGRTTVRDDRRRLAACGVLPAALVPTTGDLFAAEVSHG